MVNRRRFLEMALPALGLAFLGAGSAQAEGLQDKVVRALRRQGYREIKASRTFLGRLRVTGKKGDKRREVILNRQTGEVLRDVIVENGDTGSVFSDDNGRDTGGNTKNGPAERGNASGDDGGDGHPDHGDSDKGDNHDRGDKGDDGGDDDD